MSSTTSLAFRVCCATRPSTATLLSAKASCALRAGCTPCTAAPRHVRMRACQPHATQRYRRPLLQALLRQRIRTVWLRRWDVAASCRRRCLRLDACCARPWRRGLSPPAECRHESASVHGLIAPSHNQTATWIPSNTHAGCEQNHADAHCMRALAQPCALQIDDQTLPNTSIVMIVGSKWVRLPWARRLYQSNIKTFVTQTVQTVTPVSFAINSHSRGTRCSSGSVTVLLNHVSQLRPRQAERHAPNSNSEAQGCCWPLPPPLSPLRGSPTPQNPAKPARDLSSWSALLFCAPMWAFVRLLFCRTHGASRRGAFHVCA